MELVISDRIRNRRVDFFNSFALNLKFDAIASSFSFDYFYDPDVFELKEMACIGHYHICQLYDEGELILTGIILSEQFHDSKVKQLVTITGYSLPGVLEDCHIPTDEAINIAIGREVDKYGRTSRNLKIPSGDPIPYIALQDEGLTLKQIAEKLVKPFQYIGGLGSQVQLKVKIDSSVSKLMEDPLEKTNAQPKDTIKGYLTELAAQKNINITHDALGNLLFTKVKTNLVPVLDFDVPNKGGIIGTTFSLKFDGQKMHSQITAMKQGEFSADGTTPNASQATVTNPYCPYAFRPKTVTQTSGTDIDAELTAKNALAEELRGLTLTVTLDRWEGKKLIRPNNTITVRNPEVYCFKKTTWFIESVTYKGDQKSKTAVLNCVLPACYDGSKPEYIFAGINTH